MQYFRQLVGIAIRSKKITLQIIGMHCSACAQRIEKILSRASGVKNVSVSFASKEAIIACAISSDITVAGNSLLLRRYVPKIKLYPAKLTLSSIR